MRQASAISKAGDLHLPSDHLGSHRGDDGRIAENWHIEDNLTLLQQLGQIAK
jgi:hypothetical protein